MPARRTAFDRLLLAGAIVAIAAGTWRACTGLARAVAPLPEPACYDEPWSPCPLEPEPGHLEPQCKDADGRWRPCIEPAPAPAGLEELRDLRLTWEGCTTDLDCETRERDVLEALARRPLARGAAL